MLQEATIRQPTSLETFRATIVNWRDYEYGGRDTATALKEWIEELCDSLETKDNVQLLSKLRALQAARAAHSVATRLKEQKQDPAAQQLVIQWISEWENRIEERAAAVRDAIGQADGSLLILDLLGKLVERERGQLRPAEY
jgi:hypothetical protein